MLILMLHLFLTRIPLTIAATFLAILQGRLSHLLIRLSHSVLLLFLRKSLALTMFLFRLLLLLLGISCLSRSLFLSIDVAVTLLMLVNLLLGIEPFITAYSKSLIVHKCGLKSAEVNVILLELMFLHCFELIVSVGAEWTIILLHLLLIWSVCESGLLHIKCLCLNLIFSFKFD